MQRKLLADEKATQAQIDEMTANLKAAEDALVLVGGSTDPGTDEPGTDEPGTGKPDSDKPGTDKPDSEDKDAANTGDTAAPIAAAGGMMAALAALVWVLGKKEDSVI